MPFCPHCGNAVEQLPEVAAVAETVSADVRIAEITAERDVEIARINASLQRNELETAEVIAETEAGAQVATAEAEAEVIAAVIGETGGDDPEDPPAPVIIDSGPPPDDDPDALPPADAGGSDPGEPAHHKRTVGLGAW